MYFLLQNWHVLIWEISSHLCLQKLLQWANVFKHLSQWYLGGEPSPLQISKCFRNDSFCLQVLKQCSHVYRTIDFCLWLFIIPAKRTIDYKYMHKSFTRNGGFYKKNYCGVVKKNLSRNEIINVLNHHNDDFLSWSSSASYTIRN